ncbi:hypothetical protein [Methylorubrum extorquens]|uniref:hypothetical protein n=1 Tax=Methylorubrum extorquens TaxID=408 RepID=UPI00223758B8|nr:hypothetical protein [Methylorubrum extorquens]UYW32517.1 hypothetical protein OKB92_26735 [Methylorubrum extorquens]
MSDEDQPYEMPESSKLLAFSMLTEITLQSLIAEVAIINRGPKDAQDFVDALRERLSNFNSTLNSEDNPTDNAWRREMNGFINRVFKGISFHERSK